MMKKLGPNEQGATLLEYTLVITLIALIAMSPLKSLGNSLVAAFNIMIQNYNS